MRVLSLETEGFRMLSPARVELGEGVNVICGENAQGKTTLLEAVFLLTLSRSFRARTDRELIAFGAERAFVTGTVEAAGRERTVELCFEKGKRRSVKVNRVKKSAAEVSDCLKAVLFCPEDLQLLRAGGAEHRRMMDTAISQLRPGYRKLLSSYNTIYENKSAILKNWREDGSLLEVLDEFNEGLCRYAARICRYRAAFVRRLSEYAAPIQREFSGGREELALHYKTVSTVEDPLAEEAEIYEQISRRMRELRSAELESGSCLVGIHKDDMDITLNGLSAKSYASQGQTRTAALSMKLAERELFRADTGEQPVLLLDDVLSELDAARQEFVLNRIPEGQILITCCDEGSTRRLTGGRLLRIAEGSVL
ncbi:MAG: DNA replication/repair protein RecF [Clostridiales bacterium]|nr:DNA replication/repair protein RecF [Candidatus Apopatocola equi]